ncbi:uncharacterized protein LOC118405005 [Branchiostoma floridae]|uniref:Uncharacterized protein LOC118405005 n=1 Tax=Branchiostoma floridae TaxID=7739 RepID=A0A9J7KIA1_BRAFL|nr:uncharacterized protein LOC118405005 [Branchiostoma floridae]
MQGQLEGMLGNFDGRYQDDFVYPNGTDVPLADPRNPKEEELFSFGNTWSLRALSTFDGTTVSDMSLFTYYPEGTTAMTYGDDSYQPTFFGDDLTALFGDAALLQQAVAVCGGTTAKECLYDIAVTGDLSVGNDTMSHEKTFQEGCAILMNSPPQFESPQEIVAYVNQEYNVTLNATDDRDKMVTFSLSGNGTMTSSGNFTATYSWLPTSAEKAFVEFIVTDTAGAASCSTPKITICGCQNNGTCAFDRIVSRENGFAVSPCTCVPGFDGDLCEQDANGCADNPCFQGVTCTDVKGAINETAGEKGYKCGPCPADTTGDGETCEDVDECMLAVGDPRRHTCVNANCINTPGSYTCVCKEGYHKDGEDKVCYDIDECRSDSTNDCDWVFGYCNNTDGGYECLCDTGYISYDGGFTCEDFNECLVDNGGCERICKNYQGGYECDCGVAYFLQADERTCTELDECATNNKCEYFCDDFVGHYECHCPDLFALDDNGRTCSPYVNCSSNHTCHPAPIGECAQNWTTGEDTCVCVQGYQVQPDNSCQDIDECTNGEAKCDENAIRCDNIPGDYKCVCKAGYEHSVSHDLGKCHNINECNDNYGNCSHECRDTIGSFYCECPPGWRLGSDQRTCEDIDECSSDTLNDCSYNAVCNNTVGGFMCHCREGFTGDGSLCGDIDECMQFGERGQGGCEVGCRNFNGGYVCTCGTGYQLKNDSVSCEDTDECSIPDTCEQVCNNTLGSYVCSCRGDNVLREDGRTCRLNTNLCNFGCHEKAKYFEENSTCVCRSGYSGNGTQCEIDEPGVVVEVTLADLEYTEVLGDCTSTAFVKLKGDVEAALSGHFTGHQNFTVRDNFLSFILSTFSNGSVVANLTLATKTLMSTQDIQQAMVNVRALSIGNLNIVTGTVLCTLGRGGSRCEYLLSETTAGIVIAILIVVTPLLLVAACVLRGKKIEEAAKLYRGNRSHTHMWWNMARPKFKASFPNVPMQGAGWVTLRRRHGLGTYVEAFPYVDLDVRRYFPGRRYDMLSKGSVSSRRSSSVSTVSTRTDGSNWVAEWDDYMKIFGGDAEFRFPRNIVCDITSLIEDDDNMSVATDQSRLTGFMALQSEGSSLSSSVTSLETLESLDTSRKNMEPTVTKEGWLNWTIEPSSSASGAGHKWAIWSTSPSNSQETPTEGAKKSSDGAHTNTESGKGSSDNSSLFGWTRLPTSVAYKPFRTYTSGSASSRRSSLFGWTVTPQVPPNMPTGFEDEQGWFAWQVGHHDTETGTSSPHTASNEEVGASQDSGQGIGSYPYSSSSDGFKPIVPPTKENESNESDMSPGSDAVLDDQSESDHHTTNSAVNQDEGSNQDRKELAEESPPISMSDGFIPLAPKPPPSSSSSSSPSGTDFLAATDEGSSSDESGISPRSDATDTAGDSTTDGFTPLVPLQKEEKRSDESVMSDDRSSEDSVSLSDDPSSEDSVIMIEPELLTTVLPPAEPSGSTSSESEGSRQKTREKYTRL